MDWSGIAWWVVFVSVIALIGLYGIAVVQIWGAQRFGLVERVAWIAGVLVVPYLGVAAWFIYGRPRATTYR